MRLRIGMVLAAVVGLTGAAGAQFSQGNLVVLRVGDGSAALSNAGTSTFLDQYNPVTPAQAMPMLTVANPTTGVNRIVMSGTAASEGQITRSGDGTRIIVAGYNIDVGTTGVASTSSAAVNRVVNSVDINGVTARVGATSTNFSGNNIRSAASINGTSAYAVGGNSGTVLLPDNTTIFNTVTNQRVANIYNNNLYFSTAQGNQTAGNTVNGIYRFTGTPTASSTPTQLFNIAPGSATAADQASPYAFAVNPTETVIYVADDRSTTNGGGIQKWTFNGTTWSRAGTFSNLFTTLGARGLAVDFSGANPILYATTTQTNGNLLVALTDTGNNFGDAFTVLATAPTNTAFRGVVFSPVPEPATVGLVAAAVLGVGAVVRRRLRKDHVTAGAVAAA